MTHVPAGADAGLNPLEGERALGVDRVVHAVGERFERRHALVGVGRLPLGDELPNAVDVAVESEQHPPAVDALGERLPARVGRADGRLVWCLHGVPFGRPAISVAAD